jgi:hypothetical protein
LTLEVIFKNEKSKISRSKLRIQVRKKPVVLIGVTIVIASMAKQSAFIPFQADKTEIASGFSLSQ